MSHEKMSKRVLQAIKAKHTNTLLVSITHKHFACVQSWISILYTDFMPFADSQKKAKIYSVFLYPVYSSIHL